MLFKKRPYVHSFIKTNSGDLSFRNEHKLSMIIQTHAVFTAIRPGIMNYTVIAITNPYKKYSMK